MMSPSTGFGYMIEAWLGDLLDRRRSQIDRVGAQTALIVNVAGDRCPRTVIAFLVWGGEQNRKRTDELAGAGPWETRDVLCHQLGVIDRDIVRLDGVLKGDGEAVCGGLRGFLDQE